MSDETLQKPTTNKPRVLLPNNDLPTAFVDGIQVSMRKDDMVLLRFLANVPEGLREEARLMTPKPHLKRILDAICRQCDYYPEKAAKQSTPST